MNYISVTHVQITFLSHMSKRLTLFCTYVIYSQAQHIKLSQVYQILCKMLKMSSCYMPLKKLKQLRNLSLGLRKGP